MTGYLSHMPQEKDVQMNAYSSQNDKDFMSENWPGSSLFPS